VLDLLKGRGFRDCGTVVSSRHCDGEHAYTRLTEHLGAWRRLCSPDLFVRCAQANRDTDDYNRCDASRRAQNCEPPLRVTVATHPDMNAL
jgi:hypothetical protein